MRVILNAKNTASTKNKIILHWLIMLPENMWQMMSQKLEILTKRKCCKDILGLVDYFTDEENSYVVT